MYEIFTASTRIEKRLRKYLAIRTDIKEKLNRLKQNPRGSNDAHPLHGKLEGTWSCWLGSNLRILYNIDDDKKIITIEAVGSHKVY